MGDSNITSEGRLRLMGLQLLMTQQLNQNALLQAKLKVNQQNRQREVGEDPEGETQKKRPKKRSLWVRKWSKRRPDLGQYRKLLAELKKEDTKGFKNFLRMDYPTFREILDRIEPRIKEQGCNFRKPLSPGIKLAITLRYLASGDSYHPMMYGFWVAHNTISKIIRGVCEAIIAEFAEEMIPTPQTTEGWKISDEFGKVWNFQHCLGALDGKHIAMRCLKNAGSVYYNYKGFHSIILMALVDADYKFLWVEVGSNGSTGDAQVFNNGELKEVIEAGTLNFPAPDAMPNDDKEMPYFIVGDDVFALLANETVLSSEHDERAKDLQLQVVAQSAHRGKRFRDSGASLAVPADDTTTGSHNSDSHHADLHDSL